MPVFKVTKSTKVVPAKPHISLLHEVVCQSGGVDSIPMQNPDHATSYNGLEKSNEIDPIAICAGLETPSKDVSCRSCRYVHFGDTEL